MKIELTKPNGDHNSRTITTNVWHTVSKGVPLILVILGLLGYMWGFNRNIVLSQEEVKKIPRIESEVKTLQGDKTMLTYRVDRVEKDISEIKEGQCDIQKDIKTLLRR